MQLGWIDFSKTERSKILSVLDLLGQGTLDELGIAPVRDGFSNLFFPGTSTIQTRAKYFFLVPYICKDLERNTERNLQAFRRVMDEQERECGYTLWKRNKNEPGLIGSRSLQNGSWVKRPPSDIYWAGLRQYGIFLYPRLSFTEYLRTVCTLHNQKSTLRRLGNRQDRAEENTCDDADAGNSLPIHFWNIPTYQKMWKENLTMELTQEEAEFLKRQILTNCSGSLLAFILENDRIDLLKCESFEELSAFQHTFPEQIQKDYQLALTFSKFLFIIRTMYNVMASGGQNETANTELETGKEMYPKLAGVDLDAVFDRLAIADPYLRRFLKNAQQDIQYGKFESLQKHIRDREIFLKGESRAKTAHPGEFDPNIWIGGGYLDYRFSNAKTILKDIFLGEGKEC